jgi:hypothetical protein
MSRHSFSTLLLQLTSFLVAVFAHDQGMPPAMENNCIKSRIEDGSEALELLWSLPLLRSFLETTASNPQTLKNKPTIDRGIFEGGNRETHNSRELLAVIQIF